MLSFPSFHFGIQSYLHSRSSNPFHFYFLAFLFHSISLFLFPLLYRIVRFPWFPLNVFSIPCPANPYSCFHSIPDPFLPFRFLFLIIFFSVPCILYYVPFPLLCIHLLTIYFPILSSFYIISIPLPTCSSLFLPCPPISFPYLRIPFPQDLSC